MMPRQQKRLQLALVGIVLLSLLVGVYLAVWKRPSKGDPAIIKHPVDTSPEDALKYWTADRMRNAKPAELPTVDAPKRKKRQPRRPPHTSDPRNS